MELKEGYKQTEVGVIPKEWEVKTFGEIFSYLSTATNSRNELSEEAGAYYIHYGDIHTKFHNHLNIEKDKPPTIDRNKCRNAALIKNGDWVMADASEDYDGVGKTIEVFGLQDGEQAVAGLHTFLLREKCPVFVPRFKGHLGCLKLLHEEYLRVATGMKVFGVSKSALVDLHLPVPTKAEQEAIAEALSDADALIESLEQLIAKKRQIKQGAMQELLTGKKRLPGFSGEWEVKTLQEITVCLDNLRVPLNESQRAKMKGDFPYCGANGVLDYVDGYVIDDDIILMAEDGGYFDEYKTRPIAYRMTGRCWVNNHAHILKAKEGVDQGFVFYSLVHKNILPFLASGTRAKLNKSEMNKIEVGLPQTSDEQTAIATILSDMDAEIAALQTKLTKARQVKQGMMQELLTGNIRLI